MNNRILDLWDRLLGLYGSALLRKYGKRPPGEWESVLGVLSDAQLQHGVNELLKSGKGMPPSLPELLALCRSAREWVNPVAPQQIENQSLDAWAVAANKHMLAFVLQHWRKRVYFDPAQTRILVEWKNAWARDCRDEDAGDGVPVERQREWWQDCVARAKAAGAVGWTPTDPWPAHPQLREWLARGGVPIDAIL
jgi:hypothetical protein